MMSSTQVAHSRGIYLDYGLGTPMLTPFPLGNFVSLYFWKPRDTPYPTRGVSKGETWKNDVIGAVYDVIIAKMRKIEKMVKMGFKLQNCP